MSQEYRHTLVNIVSSSANDTLLKLSIENDIRIVQESDHFVCTSKNVATVESRYNVLLGALERLANYEKRHKVSFMHESPSSAIARLKKDKTEIMEAAAKRANF